MMDFRRLIIYFALAIVAVLLWNAWMKDHPPQTIINSSQAMKGQQTAIDAFTPKTFSPDRTTNSQVAKADTSQVSLQHKFITVKTDVLDLQINKIGGTLSSATLIKYPTALATPNQFVQMLNSQPENLYIAQSSMTNVKNDNSIVYTAKQTQFELAPGTQVLDVILTAKTTTGLIITKKFSFKRGQYAISETQTVKNIGQTAWQGSFYHQITVRNVPPVTPFHSSSYYGPSLGTPEKPYEKIPFKNMDEEDLNQTTANGWVAMQQQYFISAWVPEKNQTNRFYSHVVIPPDSNGKNNIYTFGFVSQQITLAPNQTVVNQAKFYVGPELAEPLSRLAKGLDLTIDYGWLWPISKLIFWVMAQIHKIIGNWGWSIILVTLLIKILFYPLSNKSYKSMVKMRELQPRMEQIKERHGDDKQAMSKAVMELYRSEKVNPMGGCLPMIVQIPVFIALYWVLIESVQLRQAPFVFWIHDLSVKDPYFILPILMGLSMFAQQKLSPAPPDPTQAKVMMLLPIIFTVFFATFPAGLVLYWLTNNILSVLQQWYVMKTYKPKNYKSKKKKK